MAGLNSQLDAFTTEVAQFVVERKPAMQGLALDHDTDLIDSRIIDSLLFVEFLLFLEDYFGCQIHVQSADIRMFRSVSSIFDAFRPKNGENNVQ